MSVSLNRCLFAVLLVAVLSPFSATARETVAKVVGEVKGRVLFVKDDIGNSGKSSQVKIPTRDCGVTVEFAVPCDCAKVAKVKTRRGKADVKFTDGTSLRIRDTKNKLTLDYDD